MFKQALRSSLIVLASLSLISCGGGSSSTGFSSSEDTSSSTNNNSSSSSSNSETVPTGNSSLQFSWTAPTENTDNSSLSDLSGFKIYYGISADSLTASVAVNSPSATSYTVENLASNVTYYFSITAVNSLGGESVFSSVISKTAT